VQKNFRLGRDIVRRGDSGCGARSGINPHLAASDAWDYAFSPRGSDDPERDIGILQEYDGDHYRYQYSSTIRTRYTTR